MQIFYRLSYGSYAKERFENATKENCLANFINHCFDPAQDTIWLVFDNVGNDQVAKIIKDVWSKLRIKSDLLDVSRPLIEVFEKNGIKVKYISAGSSAASFREVMEMALKFSDDEIVWFQEDDYAHLPNSRKVLLEGLERADYVTLYNHPDKYIPASKGGNPWIGDDASEQTKVFVTNSSYWMMTNSTTMTFATTVGVLREDESVWRKYTKEPYPQDMQIFVSLRREGRTLIQPIPTKATHCEPAWAAHLHGTGIKDWNTYLKPHIPEREPYRESSF